METIILNFTVEEYKERLGNTKKQMDADGIDLLLITSAGNICYITGYDAWSFHVHQMVVVALNEEGPIWIGRGIDETAATFTTWLAADNIISYPDDHVQSTTKHA